MKRLQLQKVEHNVKIGDVCGDIEPNITEDTIFLDNDEVVGFYLSNITGKLAEYIAIADAELLSDRVPKQEMSRGPQGNKQQKLERELTGKIIVTQYSTILGSVPPKPHMKRDYPTISSVHRVQSARTFIKAMLLACREAENIIKDIAPTIYDKQLKIINNNVPPKFRFGKLFTSSISNFNIAANFHRDAGNLEGCVNVIIAKKRNAKGGNTTVPDYGATVDSKDNSMLVYPAWRNVHGVTPIRPITPDGYRNSLVFYPLKAFNTYWDTP
jgi:hypothetical protein